MKIKKLLQILLLFAFFSCPTLLISAFGEESKIFTIDLSFVGDCLLATENGDIYPESFSWYAQNYKSDYFFKKVSYIFKKDDFTIANLENVLTNRNLTKRNKGEGSFWFKAPSSNTNILKSGNIDVVSLANNHTFDYGKEGYADTIKALKRANILWGDNTKTLYLKKNGYTIALIPAKLFEEAQTKEIIKRIKYASLKSDYQIVYFHGGQEGIYKPEQWKIDACHKFVDAGANLVIGNHPHRLQPIEIYKDVNIIYSLGNFCFGGNKHMISNRTIIYKTVLTIKNNKLLTEETYLIPCYIQDNNKFQNNWQPDIITNIDDKTDVFDFLFNKNDLPHIKTKNKSFNQNSIQNNIIYVNDFKKIKSKITVYEHLGYILKETETKSK